MSALITPAEAARVYEDHERSWSKCAEYEPAHAAGTEFETKAGRSAQAVAKAQLIRLHDAIRDTNTDALAKLATPYGMAWEHCTSSMKDEARRTAGAIRSALLATITKGLGTTDASATGRGEGGQ